MRSGGFARALALAFLSKIVYLCYMSTDNYQRDEHRVHLIIYHLIGRLLSDMPPPLRSRRGRRHATRAPESDYGSVSEAAGL
jgi:hypothetical protein